MKSVFQLTAKFKNPYPAEALIFEKGFGMNPGTKMTPDGECVFSSDSLVYMLIAFAALKEYPDTLSLTIHFCIPSLEGDEPDYKVFNSWKRDNKDEDYEQQQ